MLWAIQGLACEPLGRVSVPKTCEGKLEGIGFRLHRELFDIPLITEGYISSNFSRMKKCSDSRTLPSVSRVFMEAGLRMGCSPEGPRPSHGGDAWPWPAANQQGNRRPVRVGPAGGGDEGSGRRPVETGARKLMRRAGRRTPCPCPRAR